MTTENLLTTSSPSRGQRPGHWRELSDALRARLIHVDIALGIGGQGNRTANGRRRGGKCFAVVSGVRSGNGRDYTRRIHHTNAVVVRGRGDCGCRGRAVGDEEVTGLVHRDCGGTTQLRQSGRPSIATGAFRPDARNRTDDAVGRYLIVLIPEGGPSTSANTVVSVLMPI